MLSFPSVFVLSLAIIRVLKFIFFFLIFTKDMLPYKLLGADVCFVRKIFDCFIFDILTRGEFVIWNSQDSLCCVDCNNKKNLPLLLISLFAFEIFFQHIVQFDMTVSCSNNFYRSKPLFKAFVAAMLGSVNQYMLSFPSVFVTLSCNYRST